MFDIDFVMPWVDGGDPEWLAEKRRYSPEPDAVADDRPSRYRDWDNLKYWFRGIEKYAPWVRKVYFITCGHLPEWLDPDAPKLVCVKHSDYMPPEYLPTFSSHPIELNMHRIEGLSEHFVYFNDDMFLLRPVKPELFFRDGKPVHQARLHAIVPNSNNIFMPHIHVNMAYIINCHFDMRSVLRQHWQKWFLPHRNGLGCVIENIFHSRHRQFPDFASEHLPVPILKQTMETVWEAEHQWLDETSRRRFRDIRDVSQYLFRYWQLATGEFIPIKKKKLGQVYDITAHPDAICRIISEQRMPMICLNDMALVEDPVAFEEAASEIKRAFERILPQKSSFER